MILSDQKKTKSIPKVISKESVKKIIDQTANLKHKCIISLLYSAGLRRTDIDSKRMVVLVRKEKEKKDRQTLLGHENSTTTEIYTYVATNNIRDIDNLLD